jgi:hypothetical protein
MEILVGRLGIDAPAAMALAHCALLKTEWITCNI